MIKKENIPQHIKIRSILGQKQNIMKIQNKQMMRDVITDYILQSLTCTPQSLTRKPRQRKYQPLSVTVEVNGKQEKFQFTLPQILQKYISLEKSSMDRDGGIEPLTLDILNLIDQLEDKASGISLQMAGNISNETVIGALVCKHIRDRQRQALQGQYEEVKRKIYTKCKKISFIELGQEGVSRRECDLLIERNGSQQNSLRLSGNRYSALEKQDFSQKHMQLPAKSKLKLIVDSYNIFEHPEQVEALRKQKLISQFCKNEAQLIEANQVIKKQKSHEIASNSMPGNTNFIEDWINQISLSEYLFKKKYASKKEPNNNQIIIQELSSSQQSIQSG